MKLYIQLFVAASVIFLIVDGIWLGVIAWPFLKREIGHLLKPVSVLPAAIFYVMYIIGMLVFVIVPNLNPFDVKKVLMLGFLFGAVCYATYDLTNLSTLKGWSWKVSVVDIFWGGFASSITSTLVAFLFRGA